eukprot:GILJ01014355.1.p1 GENE.GILJ01014355.1~~GILJ01014355.1.p1  ORF type:complete len:367 (-),score=41.12 GILJ01014355.1:143-1243(-)
MAWAQGSNLEERQNEWIKLRDEKRAARQKIKHEKELEGHTFKPVFPSKLYKDVAPKIFEAASTSATLPTGATLRKQDSGIRGERSDLLSQVRETLARSASPTLSRRQEKEETYALKTRESDRSMQSCLLAFTILIRVCVLYVCMRCRLKPVKKSKAGKLKSAVDMARRNSKPSLSTKDEEPLVIPKGSLPSLSPARDRVSERPPLPTSSAPSINANVNANVLVADHLAKQSHSAPSSASHSRVASPLPDVILPNQPEITMQVAAVDATFEALCQRLPFKFDEVGSTPDRYLFRVQNPNVFEMSSIYRKRDKSSKEKGVSVVVGRKTDTGQEEAMSIQFDTELFNIDTALLWWSKHYRRFLYDQPKH